MLLSLLVFAYISSSFVLCDSSNLTEAQKQVNINCRWCHKIVAQFKLGYEATTNNYRGGDATRKDGRAEMQLAQIMEGLCKEEAYNRKSKCHSFVEENEELLEQWWLTQWWPNRLNPKPENALRNELFEYFCVQQKALCCGHGHFGPNCLPCDGYDSQTGKICNGHGTCNGNETYKGTGKCDCYPGYVGELCDKCDKKYYEVPSSKAAGEQESGVVGECRACHAGCTEQGCTSSEASACFECAPGWVRKKTATGSQPCVDVNECTAAESPCTSKDTFCQNTLGSYQCIDCSPSCARDQGCTGPGANQCTACRTPGYKYNSETKSCEDVNECDADPSPCKAAGESCSNMHGSYRCDCPFNEEVDPKLNKCVPRRVPLQEIGRFSANSPNVKIGSADDLREHDEF